MRVSAQTMLTLTERRLLGLLALGQTPAQAGPALGLTPADAETLLADLLRRQGLSAPRQLVARALLYRWI